MISQRLVSSTTDGVFFVTPTQSYCASPIARTYILEGNFWSYRDFPRVFSGHHYAVLAEDLGLYPLSILPNRTAFKIYPRHISAFKLPPSKVRYFESITREDLNSFIFTKP